MKNIFYFAVIIALVSCKSENINDRSPGLIQVSVADALYESEETLGNRAATIQQNEAFLESNIRRNTIELGNDFLMVSELRPEAPLSSLKDKGRAALDTTALSANIRYRLLVYTQAGAFVTERDYIRGQEASTEALQLDGGSTYTFVVFSLNITDDLPPTLPAATASRTLSNSHAITNTGTGSYMYYKHTMTITGNAINRLDIVLKHRKPRITATINSSQTGYNVTAIEALFTPHNDGTRHNLADGSYTQNGAVSSSILRFTSSLGSQILTQSTGINAPNNDVTTFTIRTITIGPLTLSNLVPFNNLNLTEGVRYNLILNIVPRDEYTTHGNAPAARINGLIWALHNVGVNTTLNHNPATITSALHGNYYQFGKIAVTAGPTDNTTNSNFNRTDPGRTWWNVGTETVPVKTTNDPCPSAFRVPTRTEMQQLLDGVVITRRGSFTEGNTNYNSAAILTSNRNANVFLVLPAQGFHNYDGTNPIGIQGRGSTANYWTSLSPSSSSAWRLVINNTETTFSENTGTVLFQSRPIRCVAR